MRFVPIAAALVLAACGSGGESDSPGESPIVEEFVAPCSTGDTACTCQVDCALAAFCELPVLEENFSGDVDACAASCRAFHEGGLRCETMDEVRCTGCYIADDCSPLPPGEPRTTACDLECSLAC